MDESEDTMTFEEELGSLVGISIVTIEDVLLEDEEEDEQRDSPSA